MKKLIVSFIVFSGLINTFVSSSCIASTINQELPNELFSSAEYLVGESVKPAVLILHGFLQTRNHITVQSLIASISDEGYSVLAPNLTLNKSFRKRSLSCEKIHYHNMAQDISEIDYWVKWLGKKGHRNIILVGHNFASSQLLAYINSKKPTSVTRLIATSLTNIEWNEGKIVINKQLKKATNYIKNNDNDLHEYPILYCKEYMSSARNYISYAKWTKNKIILELNKIKVPVSVIIGGDDPRMDKYWISQLKKINLNLIVIDGANHLFKNMHEFDLNDLVLKQLQL